MCADACLPMCTLVCMSVYLCTCVSVYVHNMSVCASVVFMHVQEGVAVSM